MDEQNIKLLSENAQLRREVEHLERVRIPTYVPFAGPVPETMAELDELPDPWRQQVLAADPGLIGDLVNKGVIARELAEADACSARRLAVLEGTAVAGMSTEDFNALPPAERLKIAESLTQAQKEAFVGQVPPSSVGYLDKLTVPAAPPPDPNKPPPLMKL